MNCQINHLLLSLLLLAAISTCSTTFERPTKVELQGGSPPTFVLSGSGTLGDLIIYGPKQRDVGSDRNFALWEIKPADGHLEGEPVDKLAKITYGLVPEGYRQIHPEDGSSPPVLAPGVRYQYWFQTINAPHARKHFEIRDGRAIEVP